MHRLFRFDLLKSNNFYCIATSKHCWLSHSKAFIFFRWNQRRDWRIYKCLEEY